MAGDPTSPIAKVEQGHGYYLRPAAQITTPNKEADYRHLRVDRLTETAQTLALHISETCPGAALSNIAERVVDITRSTAATVKEINRPNWWLRAGLIALAALVLATVVVITLSLPSNGTFLESISGFLVKIQGTVAFLIAIVVFFWTLERRFKRGKAVDSLHELRVLAHIIDMHQLSKDPQYRSQDGTAGYSNEQLWNYLRYCTELLAIVSKIGQLYVEDFQDDRTLRAGDQLEQLATGLSQKIWQKLMILEVIQSSEEAKQSLVKRLG